MENNEIEKKQHSEKIKEVVEITSSEPIVISSESNEWQQSSTTQNKKKSMLDTIRDETKNKIVNKYKYKNFIIIFIFAFINALGVGCFLIPASLIDGSISGTAFLIFKSTGFPLEVSFLLLNIPFFIIAARKLNRTYIVYSVFAIVSYTVCLYLLTKVIQLDKLITKELYDNAIIESNNDLAVIISFIFGGALSGLGSGGVIKYGGTLDGIEITAIMISRKIGLSVGQIIMVYNFIMMFSAIFVFSLKSALISIVSYFLASKVIDVVVEGLSKEKAVMIISNKGIEIAKEISERVGKGVTIIKGSGYYSNDQKNIVYYVVNRFELAMLKDLVLSIDKKAFIAISEVTDVFGQSVKNEK